MPASKEIYHGNRGVITVSIVGLLFTLGSSAWADDKKGKITDLVKDATMTIDQAIKTASETVPGTVVEAELEKKHGKTVWEVEVLGTDGNVTEGHIDASTDAVIDTEMKKGEKEKNTKKGREKTQSFFASILHHTSR
ncbi:MAG: PepSY domain-containing protein [Nitrospiraceae bacterium]